MSDHISQWWPPPLLALPERDEPTDTRRRRLEATLGGWYLRVADTLRAPDAGLVSAVDARRQDLRELTDLALDQAILGVSMQLRLDRFENTAVVHCFALLRELIRRQAGVWLSGAQLQAARTMLRGRLAELGAGEGKTLALITAAAAAALSGTPVHLVVANEYLLQRDVALAEPILACCGLSLGTILHGAPDAQRRQAYDADVLYVCAGELLFDYLRDRAELGGRPRNIAMKLRRLSETRGRSRQTLMRGLSFAIVDDADVVLLDLACSPMVLSKRTNPEIERRWAMLAWQMSGELLPERDYVLDEKRGSVELTRAGSIQLTERCVGLGVLWDSVLRREESVRQALLARHLFRRDEHYRVDAGRIRILDPKSGGMMTDRSWAEGLHQLLEVKEGCAVTGRQMPSSRISYQRFFQRYWHLAGASSYVGQNHTELWKVYSLQTIHIQGGHVSRRVDEPPRIFPTEEDKWSAVTEHAKEIAASGRPLIISVVSVATSKLLHDRLTQAGLRGNVIGDEAPVAMSQLEIAGRSGAVTILASPIGTGVDIGVDPDIVNRGGGHLIITGRLDACRLDRRLMGLLDRREQQCSIARFYSMQDSMLKQGVISVAAHFFRAISLDRLSLDWLLGRAQREVERTRAEVRADLVKRDRSLSGFLAFAGRTE